MKFLVFSSLLLLSCIMLYGQNKQSNYWELQLIPSDSDHRNGLTLNIHSPTSVVLKNVSEKDLVVWKERCSWGYYNIFFEMLIDGKRYEITKKVIDWTQDGPAPYLVRKDGYFVYQFRFDDGKWQGFPENWNDKNVKVKVIYEIKRTNEAADEDVWVGKVESNFYEVTLHK